MSAEHGPSRKPRVLVTRAADQASVLAEELRRLGAEPVVIPVIEIVPPDSYGSLDTALDAMEHFDWLIFTSANAVTALADRMLARHLQPSIEHLNIAAIGATTARAAQNRGWKVDITPTIAVAEALTETLLPHARKSDGSVTRFLLVRAQEARDVLPDALRDAGAQITIAHAYKTQTSGDGAEALRAEFANAQHPPNAVTLTSSSAARNFFALLRDAGLTAPTNFVIASIGPITSETLRTLGHAPHVEAKDATVRSLAEATVKFLKERS